MKSAKHFCQAKTFTSSQIAKIYDETDGDLMHHFDYRGRQLFCEGIPLRELARRYGTPLYVYAYQTVADHFQRLTRALSPLNHLICYAVKANSNLAILAALEKLGSGFDVVSEGELRRALAAGSDPQRCVFAGVGKTETEIEYALRQNIYAFNIESEPELQRVRRVARRLKKTAPVSFRVNPNIDAGTHAKITTGTYENKFGIAAEEIESLYALAASYKEIRPIGLQMHIGSQLTDVTPFQLALERILPLIKRLAAIHTLEFFSVGGGLGIIYDPALASGRPEWWESSAAEPILTAASYAAALIPLLAPLGLRILFEPGRFIVGNAGVLLTRVEYVKKTGRKNFVIVDAAMNDLIRPAFYDAYHEIVPVQRGRSGFISSDVVGPICESGDLFCKDRPMQGVREGEYLAVLSAGAYGSVMASNYNSRPLVAEVLVKGKESALIRNRQEIETLWASEQIPAWLRRKVRGAPGPRLGIRD